MRAGVLKHAIAAYKEAVKKRPTFKDFKKIEELTDQEKEAKHAEVSHRPRE